MKTLTFFIIFILISGLASFTSAANLDDHQQYRIVSYNFSSDDESVSDSSVKFGPLLITGSTSDIITDGFYGSSENGINDPKLVTDVFAVSANFSATPDLSLQGAIGITKNRWNAALDPDYDSSWEANLGVIYKLFNNIRYEIHFGYMDTGDLFRESQAYSDVESIIMISNKLSMSF